MLDIVYYNLRIIHRILVLQFVLCTCHIRQCIILSINTSIYFLLYTSTIYCQKCVYPCGPRLIITFCKTLNDESFRILIWVVNNYKNNLLSKIATHKSVGHA